LQDAGPPDTFPTLECLRCLEQISKQVRMIAPHVKGYEGEDLMLRIAAERTREICRMLRAYFRRDPKLSIDRVRERLREIAERLPIQEVVRLSQQQHKKKHL
jgi:DNA topoisomerase VI subunit B